MQKQDRRSRLLTKKDNKVKSRQDNAIFVQEDNQLLKRIQKSSAQQLIRFLQTQYKKQLKRGQKFTFLLHKIIFKSLQSLQTQIYQTQFTRIKQTFLKLNHPLTPKQIQQFLQYQKQCQLITQLKINDQEWFLKQGQNGKKYVKVVFYPFGINNQKELVRIRLDRPRKIQLANFKTEIRQALQILVQFVQYQNQTIKMETWVKQ